MGMYVYTGSERCRVVFALSTGGGKDWPEVGSDLKEGKKLGVWVGAGRAGTRRKRTTGIGNPGGMARKATQSTAARREKKRAPRSRLDGRT